MNDDRRPDAIDTLHTRAANLTDELEYCARRLDQLRKEYADVTERHRTALVARADVRAAIDHLTARTDALVPPIDNDVFGGRHPDDDDDPEVDVEASRLLRAAGFSVDDGTVGGIAKVAKRKAAAAPARELDEPEQLDDPDPDPGDPES